MTLKLTYDTRKLVQSLPAELFRTNGVDLNTSVVGPLWSSNLHKSLAAPNIGIVSATGPTPGAAIVDRGDGYRVMFSWSSAQGLLPTPGRADRLVANAAGYRFSDGELRVQEQYDPSGRLVTMATINGERLTFTYSDSSTPFAVAPGAGYLIRVQDSEGRSVQFTYASALIPGVGFLSSAQDESGRTTTFSYDNSGNLVGVNWPDGSSRHLVYELPSISQALTGLFDESNARLGTYGYSANGLAISTQTGTAAGRYSVSYTNAPYQRISQTYDPVADLFWRYVSWAEPAGVLVTDPLGAASAMTMTNLLGRNNLTSQSQPAGSGCAASARSQSYDVNGNVSARDDFNGTRICYASDLTRNLEIARVEGLPGGASCSVTAAGSVLPIGTRKISIQWHPDWSLPIRVAEPGRLITYVYNGQPDPYSSNAVATCAPTGALLPDGKPIAVLCSTIEQATTDASGATGFGANAQAGVEWREERWTYNARGQTLTHDGPRSDIADVTIYEYYSNTSFPGSDPTAIGHTVGDLMRVTNPAGYVTQFPLYNRRGQVLQSVDPNGVVTSYSYDARQRMTSSTIGSQTTTYAWWPTGLIQRVTAPDGSWTFYEHDDAHRLWRMSDNLGNSVSYSLDKLGNRIGESVVDPFGTLRRSVARGIDALGRVEQVTGRE